MSSQGTVTEGEHLIQSGADLVLASTFGNVRLMAHYSEGNVIISGAGSASMDCGPAALWLKSSTPLAGTVILEAGIGGTVTITSGPPFEGPSIETTPETITLSVGASKIVMTPASITLMVAEATYTLTAEGIAETLGEVTRAVTFQGHNLTAGETEFNLGLQGETKEGPTMTSEAEGGSLENQTLASNTTNAMKNEDSGIEMTV
jgi:hypothetical protein